VLLLARAHTHVGHFHTAAQLWSSALAEVPADRPEHPALRRTLGIPHFWRGHRGDAHKHFVAGLAAGDEAATVRLLVSKAHCLHQRGQGTQALETLHSALPLAEKLGGPKLLARVWRGARTPASVDRSAR